MRAFFSLISDVVARRRAVNLNVHIHLNDKDKHRMLSLKITPLFIAIFALLQVTLAILVSTRRAKTGVQFLDGGDTSLLQRIRAHGNFTETIPIALLTMAAAEILALSSTWLWVGGTLLLVGRLAHAIGVVGGNILAMRYAGMSFTTITMLGFSFFIIFRFLS
jgi:uncharacterized protein